MDIPVRPEPEEFPKIKRAMRAARFMSWGSTLLTGVFAIAAVIVGVFVAWYFGVALFVVMEGLLLIVGYSCARCPRCGQVWWTGWFDVSDCPKLEAETESFCCRRCHLDIGLGLR